MERLTIEKIKNLKEAMRSNMNVYFYDDVMKVFDELLEKRNAEEQGLLLRLPFSLGQAIYWIATKCDIGLEEDDACDKYECDECPYNETLAVAKGTVKTYHIIRFLEGTLERQYFLTKEEAEQALARMEESHE